MNIYLVGGAVRDELLSLSVKDRDWVVTGATPEDMLRQGYKQVGADFPVFLHPDTGEEYALARTERKNGHGYHGFTVYSAPDVTLEQDLLRRDLTINAMAQSDDGAIVDPFDGQKDLEAKLLRHVSDAFAEDPLRILRTARFAARLAPRGFSVADETQRLMTNMVADGELEYLAPERVWQEIVRALDENDPPTFFKVLRACNALSALIPELDDATTFEAAMAALELAHQNGLRAEGRFAALLSPLNATIARKRAQALKAPNDFVALAPLACKLGPALSNDAAIAPSELLALLDDMDAWRRAERFDLLLQTLACVLPESHHQKLEQLRSAHKISASVDAKALMAEGFTGKELGQAIRSERLRRISDLIRNQ